MNKQEIENIKQKALDEHIPIIMDDTLNVIAKYLKEIILDNFPEFNFNGKSFWLYLEEEISSKYLVKQPPSILKNE